jgi:hypothetical protein
MSLIPQVRFLPLCFFGIVCSAFAQTDANLFASDLRAKYGPPLAREIFLAPPGEMIVDYSASGHVCRIQLPPIGPHSRQPGVKSTQAVDDFLLELVPLKMRGKELMRRMMSSGLPSVSVVEYENVVIAEGLQGTQRTEITVTFRNQDCQKPVVQ